MGTATILSAEIIWKFIEPILGDKIKEAIKKKESSQIAKNNTINLYKCLGKLKEISNERVKFFNDLIVSIKKNGLDHERTETIESEIEETSEELMKLLSRLVDTLEDLYPQLEIHNSELYTKVNDYKKGFWSWYSLDFDEAILEFEKSKDNQLLEKCYLVEEENVRKVTILFNELRQFIAKEFSFKESF